MVCSLIASDIELHFQILAEVFPEFRLPNPRVLPTVKTHNDCSTCAHKMRTVLFKLFTVLLKKNVSAFVRHRWIVDWLILFTKVDDNSDCTSTWIISSWP